MLGMSAIHSFEAKQRGSASSTMSFVRSLGMTIGITVYGIIQRNDLESSLVGAFGGVGAPQGMNLKEIRATCCRR
ncbi:MFS transporter [Paenibacillus tyrfis]|uniref:MFS transporter n=1 Tax=Paenibacillus tyrfis TaxID=1501230 RepID=UPI00117C85B1|nr:MFS transporter [Paenibacillus tyrfis]